MEEEGWEVAPAMTGKKAESNTSVHICTACATEVFLSI